MPVAKVNSKTGTLKMVCIIKMSDQLPKFSILKWAIPIYVYIHACFFKIHPDICCCVSCIHLNNRELGEFPIKSFIIRKHQIACISSHFITGAL